MVKIKILTLALFIISASYLKAQKEKITLLITYKAQYCGGARPTPEMIADAEKSKAYANKMIVIVSDKFKVDSAKTNEKGQLILKVKKGTYSIYESWKFYKTGPGGTDVAKFDRECLKMEWERPLFRIIKNGKKASVENGVEIFEPCPWTLPCLHPENMGPVPE